jgi:hypothetical protein
LSLTHERPPPPAFPPEPLGQGALSGRGLMQRRSPGPVRALVGAPIRVTPVVVACADTERVATETGGVTFAARLSISVASAYRTWSHPTT